MSNKKINTTASIGGKAVTDKDLQKQIDALGQKFKEEKKVAVSIPKGLQRNIGSTLFVGVNGVSLVLPVDGEKHQIPETFAKQVENFLKNLTT